MQTTRHTLEKQLKLAWSIFQKSNPDVYDFSFNNPIPMNGEGPIRKIMGLTKTPISKEPLVRVSDGTNQVLYSMGNFDDQALHYILYEALKTLAQG